MKFKASILITPNTRAHAVTSLDLSKPLNTKSLLCKSNRIYYYTLIAKSGLVELNGDKLTVHETISAHVVACIHTDLTHFDEELNTREYKLYKKHIVPHLNDHTTATAEKINSTTTTITTITN